MAVTLTGTNGLFTRLGKIFQVMKRIETHQEDGTSGLAAEIEDIFDEYTSADEDMLRALAGQTLAIQMNAANAYTQLRTAAQTTLIEMVNDDEPLAQKTLAEALRVLARQMDASSDSIDGNDTGGSISYDSNNTGNGYLQVGQVVRYDYGVVSGVEPQFLRAEDVLYECIRDSQENGVTAGRETFSVRGEKALSDIRHPDWPGGSGLTTSIRVSDPAEDAQSSVGKNRLTNSDFEDFTTTNTPDNWVVGVGDVGTDILEEGTTVYRGSKCLEIAGDGSTLVSISQQLDTSGQTAGKLVPDAIHMIYLRISADTSVVGGVLRVAVKDGSNNILDSSNAAVSVTLSGVSTGGTFDTAVAAFSAPTKIPDTTKVVIELTTALTNTKSIYIDDVFVGPMIPLQGGQAGHANIFPGSTPWVRGDRVTLTATNDLAGDFSYYMDKCFDLYGLGIYLPINTAGGETINDNLIA